MSLSRRILYSSLVLLLAATACRKKEEGPEAAPGAAAPTAIETKAVAGDLPTGAAAVLSMYDLESFWTRLKATQLYTQLTAIPQVQAVLDPKQNPRLAQALQQFQTVTGAPLNEQTLFKTLGKKIQIGVYPEDSDTSGTRVVILADIEDEDALASILNNVKTSAQAGGRSFKTQAYKGVDVTIVSDSAGVRGLYAFHKDKLVAANDQAGFQSAVDALDSGSAAMQGDSLYRRALPHVGDAAMTLFVRRDATRAFLERARRAAGDSTQTANAERMLEVADRYNIQSGLVAGWGWTDQGLSVRTYSMLDTSSPGAAPLRDMLKTPPSKIDVTGYFPDSTLGFYAVNFLDAPRIYDFAVAYLKDIAAAQDTSAGASAAAEVDSAIARFEKQAGMSVRNDVLGWMGRQAAFGLNDVVKGGFFPVPELTLAVQAADTAKARAFFTKLEVQITAAVQSSPQAFPVQFQEEDYKGVKIRFAPTPMGEGLAPAYAIHEGYALVALSGGTLKRMLDTKGGAVQPVRANPRFEAAGAFYPPQASSVGFVDLARLVGEIGAAISSFQQMRGGGAASPEQDTLRQVVAALQNLQAVAFYGTNDANGIEQRVLVKVQ